MIWRKGQVFWAKYAGSVPITLASTGVAFAALAFVAIILLFRTGASTIAPKVHQPTETVDSPLATAKVEGVSEESQAHTLLVGEEVKVRRGDTLLRLLNRHGVGKNAARDLIATVRPYLAPKSLRSGDKIALLINPVNREVHGLEYLHRDQSVRVRATAQGWEAERNWIPSVKETRVIRGTVSESLYESGVEAGLTPNQIMMLAELFEYRIDFFSDFQRGDEFSVLADETRYEDGRRESGNIIAAELQAGGEPFRIFRFTGQRGRADYYDGDGRARRRAFLRAPLSFTRISSRYNPKRRHPIFRTVRPHRAIDYAAPAGTPVVALGNGRVTHAGWKGGYGKMVEISHADGYATRYAHFSRIAATIRRGTKVAQGQVVGYVGETGHATGPHLHFEMLRQGRKINFLGLRIPTTERLRGKDLQQFVKEREITLAQLLGKSTLVANGPVCSPPGPQAC
jgi:murein DD-endopeptidase MepM/ murein hydrolase activator NlpD